MAFPWPSCHFWHSHLCWQPWFCSQISSLLQPKPGHVVPGVLSPIPRAAPPPGPADLGSADNCCSVSVWIWEGLQRKSLSFTYPYLDHLHSRIALVSSILKQRNKTFPCKTVGIVTQQLYLQLLEHYSFKEETKNSANSCTLLFPTLNMDLKICLRTL